MSSSERLFRPIFASLVLVGISYLGCVSTDSSGSPAPLPPEGQATPAEPSVNKSASDPDCRDAMQCPEKLVFSAGQTIMDFVSFQAQVAVKAVFAASQMSGLGQLISYGTLTQYGPNLDQFSYAPQPQDKLRIILLDKKVYEYQYQDFRGNFQSGPESFLSREHALKFKFNQEGQPALEINSAQFWSGERTGSVKGQTKVQDITYDVDLVLAGSYHFDIDSTGSEYKTDYTLEGKIKSPGLDISLKEQRQFNLVTSGRTSASSSVAVINNTLRNQDSIYRLVNLTLKKAFKNGKASDPDFWKASGLLLKNEKEAGQVRIDVTPQQALFVLHLADGRSILLESWNLW